jgi:hypothetical protein
LNQLVRSGVTANIVSLYRGLAIISLSVNELLPRRRMDLKRFASAYS